MRRLLVVGFLLLITMSLFAGGCGGHGGTPGAAPPVVTADIDLSCLDLPVTLRTELESAPVPAGVDAELWAGLVRELASVVSAADGDRAVSTPPTGERNAVSDLHIVDDGGMYLAWTYRCAGDYNQDSLVTVSDLTPVGIYYGATAGSEDWGSARAADGDGNGVITVSDITPIGQNYNAATVLYNIYSSTDPADCPADAAAPNGPGTTYLSSAAFNDQPVGQGGRREFSALVETPLAGEYYWVRPSDGTSSGAPSNATSRNGRGDWWMAGRGPSHQGCSPYFASRTADIAWDITLTDEVRSAPAIRADGVVYVPCDDGLHAVNPGGTLAWSFPTAERVEGGPAIAADGTVYIGCWDDTFYAINPDGTEQWHYTDGPGAFFTPAIGEDGAIYVGCGNNNLYALEPDGILRWTYPATDAIHAAPAIDGAGLIYFGDYAGVFHAVNPDGTAAWTFNAGDAIHGAAALADNGTVYFGSSDDYLYAVSNGTELWNHRMDGPVYHPPAIGTNGTVYACAGSYTLHAFTPDGALLWETEPFSEGCTTPVIGADGSVYYGGRYDYLYSFNNTGNLQWERDVYAYPIVSPVISADGSVIIGTEAGRLFAINGGTAATPAEVQVVYGHEGVAGTDTTVRAVPNGSPPFTVNWDFGGGATPNTATGLEPAVTLGAPGFYDATVTIGNDAGTAAPFSFTLHVHSAEGPGNGWLHSWSGDEWEYGLAVAAGPGGEVYAAGYTHSFGADRTDLVLLVFSAGGTLLDSRTWDYAFYDSTRSIFLDTAGNIYIAGSVDDGIQSDALLLKLNSALEPLWARAWDSGGADDAIYCGTVSPDGRIILGGRSEGGPSSSDDTLFLVFDADGSLLKSSVWDGGGDESLLSCVCDPAGNIYLSGATDGSGAGYDDALLVRVLPDLSLDWMRTCGSADYEWLSYVTVDAAGNPYLALGAGVVAAFNTTGSLQWTRNITGGNVVIPTGIACSGDRLVVCGSLRPADRNDDGALLVCTTTGDAVRGLRLRASYEQDGLSGISLIGLDDVRCVGYGGNGFGTWTGLDVSGAATSCTAGTPAGTGTDIPGTLTSITGTMTAVTGELDRCETPDDAVIVMRCSVE